MLPTMYVAVEREGYDIYELTDFVNNDVVPYLSRQEGVASISTIGLVEKSIQVELNQEKIDELNDRILKEIDASLSEAQETIDEAAEALDKAQSDLEDAQSNFGSMVSSAIFSQIDDQSAVVAENLKSGINTLSVSLNQLSDILDEMEKSQDKTLDEAKKSVDFFTPTLFFAPFGAPVNACVCLQIIIEDKNTKEPFLMFVALSFSATL